MLYKTKNLKMHPKKEEYEQDASVLIKMIRCKYATLAYYNICTIVEILNSSCVLRCSRLIFNSVQSALWKLITLALFCFPVTSLVVGLNAKSSTYTLCRFDELQEPMSYDYD